MEVRKVNDKLPEGWEIIPFSKAAKVISDEGKRVKQRDYLPEGEIPVIDQGQDFIGGYIEDENMAFKGDLPVIIFGDHTRNIKYINRRFAVGAEGVKILKPESCYESKFFYYMLHSLEIPSRGYSRHFQFLKKFDFSLAPYDVQKLIVSEIEKQFSRLDEAVAALKRVQASLKRYKASVLKAAVEGKLTEEWRKRRGEVASPDSGKSENKKGGETPPLQKQGAELLKRILTERRKKWEEKNPGKKYKEPSVPDTSNLPELPKGWVWVTVGQIAESMKNGIYKPRDSYSANGVACLRMYNIEDGRIAWKDIKRMSLSKEEVMEYQLLPGDLLVNRVNSRELVGKAAPIPKGLEVCVFESKNIRVRLFSEMANSKYVSHVFSVIGQNFFNRNAQQVVGMASISQPQVSALPIPLPPISEQNIIINEVESHLSIVDEVKLSVDTNLKRAERLRQAILKKAFSGRLF